MTRRDVIEAAARMIEGHRLAGVTPPRPPTDPDATIARLSEAVAPLELPQSLIDAYSSIDPATIGFNIDPPLLSVDDVIELHGRRREVDPIIPRILLPIASNGRDLWSVELDDADKSGGAVYMLRDNRHVLIALDVMALFEMVALALGDSDTMDHKTMEEVMARQELSVPLRPRPIPAMFSGNLVVWPTNWVAAEVPTFEDLAPRGATMSVAELNQAIQNDEAKTGRIQGSVGDTKPSKEGTRIAVSDDTGSVEIWASAVVDYHNPARGAFTEFEVMTRTARHAMVAKQRPSVQSTPTRTTSDRGPLAALGLIASRTLQNLWGLDTGAVVLAARPVR